MTSLKKVLRRAILAAALAAGLSIPFTRAADQPASLTVDDLKAKAFAALKDGKFDVTNEYLTKAAALDPKLKIMSDWTQQFETQRKAFADERQKEYDKAYADVQLLLQKHKDSFAIDAATRTYVLAADKDAFGKQAWVDTLVKETTALGQKYEADEEWIKAMRVYSDLSQVEPAVAEWKDRLKIVTRRVRLLATYTPDVFKALQDSEAKERQEVDNLLHPTTNPIASATTKPDDDTAFKNDWHDNLKSVQMEMLRQALHDANDNYYRDMGYKQMMVGGLKSLQVVLTTKGLEKEFDGMKDAAKVKATLAYLDDTIKAAQAVKVEDSADLLKKIIGDPRANQNEDRLGTLRKANLDGVNLPEEVLVGEFADGAFAELDPFTNMIWPAEVEEFKKQTEGHFNGVGIQIQSDEDGSLKVVSPLEDSPAFKAGIKAGDIVTQINSKNAKGITLNQAVHQITGPAHTAVTLTIRSSDGTTRELTLVREEIKVTSIKGWMRDADHGGWDYFIDPQQKIAYIRLTNFTSTTSADLKAALDVMKVGQADGARGIILDLRYDPGGLLTAAFETCNRFIDKGVIVSTHPDRQTPNQPTEMDAEATNDKVDVPMIVLVNQYSASASEIVSGALKDHHRALIVGERSFGKGSVQMLFPVMIDKSAYLKLTTSHYYLPSGRCLHREENSTVWGVDPDVKVEVTPEQMRTAIDARQDADILRNKGEIDPKTAKKPVDPLASDSQLSAALLLMRLELNGAPSLTATADATGH